MAIPWLVVLQNVPWTDVIRNAPKVAEGARKLWGAIGKKPDGSDMAGHTPATDLSPQDQVIAELQLQISGLEASTAALHEQILASAELIKELAEQNAQLVKRIETNRLQMRWMLAALSIVAIFAGYSLYLATPVP